MEEVYRLLEEAYVELSRRYGWYYPYSPYPEYGAPIPVGNKKVWGKEGLYEEVNRKLRERGYRELSWEEFKELLKRIERPGVIWVNWILAPNGQVEPHSITIMKPVFRQA